ncbi:hypothetical protein BDY24DRAFT_286175 [Mrakia frigida]|uniref:uncharacterized protein n=1 Tax=Mrakia frigida TaxID=29902 RepID=UPI003FCC0430
MAFQPIHARMKKARDRPRGEIKNQHEQERVEHDEKRPDRMKNASQRKRKRDRENELRKEGGSNERDFKRESIETVERWMRAGLGSAQTNEEKETRIVKER